MRCPKCGYISFDHLEQCLKCKKNIKAVSDTLHGTVFNVAAPNFLNFSARQEKEPDGVEAFVNNLDLDEEFVDEDLDVLVEDPSDSGKEDGTAGSDMDSESPEMQSSTETDGGDGEDREIEIDLSQFEDSEVFEAPAAKEQKPLSSQEKVAPPREFPAELSDLSDLAPPSRDGRAAKSSPGAAARKDRADIEMDDLNFDLGLGTLESEPASGLETAAETVLALDDIDFSEALEQKNAAQKPSSRKSGAGMDDDLNFELDLGDLTLEKDK